MKYLSLLILSLSGLFAQNFPTVGIKDLQGSGAPGMNCAVGQRYFRTDATAGQNMYYCTATNTWTQVTGGGAPAVVLDAKNAYSAVCDGSTTTATAIQNALDAAATAGGTVFLTSIGCSGSYNLGTTGLTIPENVTLAGAGRVLSKLKYTGTGAAITMGASGTASRHHVVRDLSIDLESAGTGAIGISLIRTFYDTISDVDIRFAITASHQSQVGMKFDGGGDFGSGAAMYNVTMSGCMLYGFWFTGSDYLKSYTANTFLGGTAVQSCSSGTGMTAGSSITGATAANPSVITTSGSHGIPVGALVKVSGVTGSIGAAINSYFVASAVTSTTITLEGSFGSGLTYTSGGTVQMATTGVYWHNGDQNKLITTGVEDFEVGVASNRYGNEAHTRLEGNTVDLMVTANSEGFVGDGSFAPATIINRGVATTLRSTSPAQQLARLFNLTAESGLKVSGATGTELNQKICLASNPSADCDILWTRNYAGNSTITTSSGNAATTILKAGTGQSTVDILQISDSSNTVMSRITSTGAFSGPVISAALGVTKTSSTVLAVAAGVNTRGNTSTSVSAATMTITAGSGNGTAYVYITEGDVITIEHPTAAGITVSCSGCVSQQVTTPATPANSRILATVTISSGTWGTVTDLRGLYSRPVVCGTGLSCNDSGGVLTTSIDTADVPRLGGSNTYTGNNDFSAATVVGINTSPVSRSVISVYDEFIPGSTTNPNIGSLNWFTFGNTGINGATAYSTINHPGVVRTRSDTTANAGAGFRLDNNNEYAWMSTPGTSGWDSIFIFKPEFTGNASHYLIGWVDQVADLPNNGLYVRAYNSSSGCTANNSSEGTFQFTARASSTSTSSASTKTITSGEWYSLRIRSTSNGTVLYSLAKSDGSPETEVSISTNIPTANLFPIFLAITCNTSLVGMYADYFAFYRTGLTR